MPRSAKWRGRGFFLSKIPLRLSLQTLTLFKVGMNSSKRIAQQLAYLVETDKLKSILRKTSPIAQERLENSAEHTWQAMMSAIILHEYSNVPIDLLRVLKMLAIHDVVEIDIGDVFHYDKNNHGDLRAKEEVAAKRIFGLLPADQVNDFIALWREFEDRSSPESKFAAAVDRLMGFLMNYNNNGGTWVKYGVTVEKILSLNQHVKEGSRPIWDLIEDMVSHSTELGYVAA